MSLVEDQERTTVVEPSRPLRRKLRGGRRLRDGHYLYWWVEVLAIGAFYLLYSSVRNLNHSNAAEAFRHARELIDLQRDLGIFHEQAVQHWALSYHWLIVAANYFYGSLHFVVTGCVLIYMYRKWSDDYPLWRNTLAAGTAIALIGFAFFPLMPPRLLPAHYGFVDTLVKDPAFWSFNSGAVSKISNQYAAMPSVHCAWALWCACVLVPRVKPVWGKMLACVYPAATVFTIVITANHYFLDAPAGFVTLGLGYLAARVFTRAGRGPAVDVASSVVAPSPDDPSDHEAQERAQHDHEDEWRADGVHEEVDAHVTGVEQAEHQQ
ncbi:MAG TPA: phosphatase PAP2 family protein [Acidimicrobiia bacterium]|nr:phosphatase PAP2 family protein [Acidimicrobiia bacterium]